MWPLQPTQGIPDRLAAALAALVVTGAVLTLILMLTMGGRHEAKRAVTLPVVYWSGPPPESPAAPSAAVPSAPAVSSIALARPVHRVPPQYPVKAKQQGIEGYVVMDLRINAEGRVEDVRVVREKPEGVFRASALRVVRRWAFMPPAEPAWQRLTIRYELEK